MCLIFVFYTLILQLNAFQYEWQCCFWAITLLFCQQAKLQIPVMVSTGRCPSLVNAPRCNRMRNPSQFPRDGLDRTEGAELGKLHPGRGGSQALDATVSGILYKLPHSSSSGCHTRTVHLVACKVCLYIWHPGASAYRAGAYLLKHHISDADIQAQRL